MATGEEVAIVGYACRLPGAGSSRALWRLIEANRCSVTEIDSTRFATKPFLHPAPDQRGRSYTFAAGIIDDVWGFDANAFGMSPREAEQLDPQQRHMLEVTHDALAHAGIRPSCLAGSETGVYVGASSADHAVRFFVDPSGADMHMMTGNSLSIIANRLSYALDLHGPSLTVDSACSSSMVALDLAAEAIRSGKIDTAIVGGVNLVLAPFSYVGFSRASMLSPSGLCRPFDAAADGYVRAEGAIAVVLRSMAAARKDCQRIHAVIVGSGVNQDGRTTGLSLPSAESQRQLLDKIYERFSIDPADLSFVEAHGTGTPVGDPIEARALGAGLGQRRRRPLPIGSIKSNVGHLEPASGLAGLVKSVMALDHRVLPATLHQRSPNPNIDFESLNLDVVGRNQRLPERRGDDLVGINSFGFGGTNAHAILRSDRRVASFVQVAMDPTPPPLLLTAHSAETLKALAAAYLEEWPADGRRVASYLSASAHQRDSLPHRAVIRGDSAEDVQRRLASFARGEPDDRLVSSQALGNDLPVTFLFSGNGAQWAGMGCDAWRTSMAFREALQELDGPFGKHLDWSIVKLLFADNLASRLRQATYSQPLLLALQVATVRALEAGGISASAALGHSVGEIAAAWYAGALSLEQAIRVVRARSRHQETVRSSGRMAALMLNDREARRFLALTGAAGVEIAAINSWRSVTVSGPAAGIDKVLEAAAASRISARQLDLDYPFHSALIDPVRAPLLHELGGLKPLATQRRLISSVTGIEASGDDLDAIHWWRNVREPVQFEAALGTLMKDGARLFVEIGPKPILTSYVRDALRESAARGAVLETLGENDGRDDPIERCAARVVTAGGRLDRSRLFGPPPGQTVSLPLYPWQHMQFKVAPTDESGTDLMAPRHPLLGLRPRLNGTEWHATIDPLLYPWLADHKVAGTIVLPATAYLEILLAAARETLGDGALELRDFDIVHPLVFDGTTSLETTVRLTPETGVTELLSRARNTGTDWTMNARGIVGRSPMAGKAGSLPETASGTVVVPQPRVYAAAQALGFEYGQNFQRVRQVAYPEPKFSVATLDRSDALLPGIRLLDVAGLDTAFHAVLASDEAGVADMPMKRMLPVRFASVRLFATGTIGRYTTTRTLRQSPTSVLMDFDLWDENGRIIAAAQGVRLVEAPADISADPHSLGYRLTNWQLDEAGVPAVPALAAPFIRPMAGDSDEAPALVEGILLVEAGSLRAARNALARNQPPDDATSSTGATDPLRFIRPALLWHLDSRNLAAEVDGDGALPEIASIVGSLLVRHPKMATEAASLSRLEEIITRMLAGDGTVQAELGSTHWKQLGVASLQIVALRDAAMAAVVERLAACDGGRLLRVLMIGAGHSTMAIELCERFANVEVTLTDIDDDRLDQVRAALGEDAPHIRTLAWSQVGGLPATALDLAVAIDSLSEIAAAAGSLDRLSRLLRPGAPIIASELAPGALWDVVRGTRPTWWARSASVDFPVGALLTAQEWVEELQDVGLSQISVQAVDGASPVGVLLQGLAASRPQPEVAAVPSLAVRWSRRAAATAELETVIAKRLPGAAEAGAEEATDVILPIAASETVDDLVATLDEIADQCRTVGGAVSRLWVVMDFGTAAVEPLQQPAWCMAMAALRVARNEHAGLDIRCVGVGGLQRMAAFDRIAAEMLSPSPERELFFTDGKRLVFRVERGVASATVAKRRPAPGQILQLAPRTGASRGALSWIAAERQPPGEDAVEIEVATTGLNFRDVMWNLRLLPEEALEDGYAGPGLGMECAGTIVRVGRNVRGIAPGDRVVAFVPNAFASHVVAPSFAVSQIPDHLSFEAATTLPVAFLTAYYALVHLGRIGAGDVVLIHGGAGAVGLAALQVAKHYGATTIVTAGSEEKRALLSNLGADFVCNSRTLAFADEIAGYTGGKGVDIVLNSLAGEAMVRSLDCLKPFGRFIELGKRDFYANTHLGLRPLRRNLSYFGVDVDQLLNHDRATTERLFAEILRLFADHVLMPLPHRVFDGANIAEAFRLMQRAGHIGKIIVTPATHASAAAPAGNTFPVSAGGLHIVIGGTSGFGLATAEWLADRGARRIVLASRSGILSEAAARQVEHLRKAGVEIDVATADAGDVESLRTLLQRCEARGPIKGIVNAAMVLDDRLMQGLDRRSIANVLMPKVAAALHLEHLAGPLALDYLLLFSSATTLFGNPGQFNYVAANGFVEGVARRLHQRGLPALAVAWGAIEDAGYLARHIEANAVLKKRFAATLIPARVALNGLDWAFGADGRQTTACCAIARIDWAMAKRELAAVRTTTFAAIDTAAASRQGGHAALTLDKLRAMPPDDAAAALLDIMVEEIARVLRLPPKEVDRHRPLADIGMDSLMMLELRNVVEDTLQIDLPMMSLASGITPADVVRRVLPLVMGESVPVEAPRALVALSTSHLAAEAEQAAVPEQQAAVNAVLERLQKLGRPQ